MNVVPAGVFPFLIAGALFGGATFSNVDGSRGPQALPQAPDLQLFFQAASRDEKEASAALAQLAESWRDDYAAMIVDMARLMRPAARGPETVHEEITAA